MLFVRIEFDQSGEGTRALGMAIVESEAFSLAGEGDTLAAIDKCGIADRLSYISTGISTVGGAFPEYVEGKQPPAVAIPEQRAAERTRLDDALPGSNRCARTVPDSSKRQELPSWLK